MAIAVTTVASGGLPVTDVTATHTKLGLHVAEVAKGLAITKVPGGLPVNFAPVQDWPGVGGGGGGGGGGAEATAFLARTSGLDATHTNAYTALIDGLVADGIWTKFDVLYILATQNTATAHLNLVGTHCPITPNGSPTFTTDRGYTGVSGSTTVYLNTGYNAATTANAKYTQNSAHVSAWSVTNISDVGYIMGVYAGGSATDIQPIQTSSGQFVIQINHGTPLGVNSANGSGHFIADRSGALTISGYRNGSATHTNSSYTSVGPPNSIMYVCAFNSSGSGFGGSAYQTAMASAGASLTAGEATAFYNRLRTYMTAVGVP